MNSRNLQTFSEKRLLNMSKKSGLSTEPERLSAKERLDSEKAKIMGKKIEGRKKTPTPEISKPDLNREAVNKHIGYLDDNKLLNILKSGGVKLTIDNKEKFIGLENFTTHQVDIIVGFLDKKPKHIDYFLSQLSTNTKTNGRINISQLSPLAKEMLIGRFGNDRGKLTKLFRKLFASPASANETIAVVEEVYKSDPNMLETAMEILLEKGNEILSKLSAKSLAIFLNKASNSLRVEIYKKTTNTQKAYLLYSDLNEKLKTEVWEELKHIGFEKLNSEEFDIVILYTFKSEDKSKINHLTSELVKNPELIKKLLIYGALTLLKESFEKEGMENLWKLLLTELPRETRLRIIGLKNLNERVRNAIAAVHMEDEEPKILEEYVIKGYTKEQFIKKTAEQKIETVEDFKIEGGDIKFTIEEVERSFIKNSRFLKELEKPKYDSPLKIKLACYKELLRIITKDGSIKTNIHNLKGDWKKSNKTLEEEIKEIAKEILAEEKELAETPTPAPAAKPEPGATLMTPVAPPKATTKKPTQKPAPKPKEKFAPTEKEAIAKTMKKIQSIATELGKSIEKSLGKMLGMNASRKVEINTTPEGSGMYPIYVDGQKSNYIVGIFTFPSQAPNKGFKSLFFVRRKDQAGPEIFTSGDEQGLKDELTNAIKSVPNNKILPPEIQVKVIEKLKTIGLTLVLPEGVKLETLTMENIRTLFDSHVKVQTSITNGTNIHEIVKKLKEVGQRLRKFAKNYLPAKTKIEFTISKTQTLVWDPDALTVNGFGVITKLMKFGSKEILTKEIAEFKKAQLTPRQFKTFRGQNERRGIEIKRENATEKRLERYKQNYKTLATKKFMIDKRIGYRRLHMFETKERRCPSRRYCHIGGRVNPEICIGD